jgi:microcystin-dependent protein
MGQGNGAGLSPRVIGETGGEESHTLLVTEIPPHTHPLGADANAGPSTNTPSQTVVLSQTSGRVDNQTVAINLYATDSRPSQTMAPASVGPTGGQGHSNIMPYLAINFCISLSGIFPSRN